MANTAEIIEFEDRNLASWSPALEPRQLAPDSLGGRVLARAFPTRAWCSAAVRELLEAEPGFGPNLLTQGVAYVHVLALAHLEPDRLPADARERARFLMRTSYRDILTRALGAPDGLARLLRKLGTRVLERSSYETLAWAVTQPPVRKALAHSRAITAAQLRAFASLPSAYAVAPVMRELRSAAEANEVVAHVLSVEAIMGESQRSRVAASFASVGSVADTSGWLERILSDIAFPAPPWAGSERLRPVRTAAELRRIAQEMRNCAAIYVDEALRGTHAFYLWRHRANQVLIMLERRPYIGWVIAEMKGTKNRRVKPATTEQISREFDAGGIIDTRLRFDTREWL